MIFFFFSFIIASRFKMLEQRFYKYSYLHETIYIYFFFKTFQIMVDILLIKPFPYSVAATASAIFFLSFLSQCFFIDNRYLQGSLGCLPDINLKLYRNAAISYGLGSSGCLPDEALGAANQSPLAPHPELVRVSELYPEEPCI